MGSYGWALNQSDQWPYKKRTWRHTHAQRDIHGRTWGEHRVSTARRKALGGIHLDLRPPASALPGSSSPSLSPAPRSSDLQPQPYPELRLPASRMAKKIDFWCLRHSFCVILLWQTKQTHIPMFHINNMFLINYLGLIWNKTERREYNVFAFVFNRNMYFLSITDSDGTDKTQEWEITLVHVMLNLNISVLIHSLNRYFKILSFHIHNESSIPPDDYCVFKSKAVPIY